MVDSVNASDCAAVLVLAVDSLDKARALLEQDASPGLHLLRIEATTGAVTVRRDVRIRVR